MGNDLKIELDGGGSWRWYLTVFVVGLLAGGGTMRACLFEPGDLLKTQAAYDQEISDLKQTNDDLKAEATVDAEASEEDKQRVSELETALDEARARADRPEVVIINELPPRVIEQTPPEVLKRVVFLEGSLQRWILYSEDLEEQLDLEEQRADALKSAVGNLEDAYLKVSKALAVTEQRAAVAEARVDEWEQTQWTNKLLTYGGTGLALAVVAALLAF